MISLADELFILRGDARIGDVALHAHAEIVLLAQLHDGLHHGGVVVGIDGGLVLPAVDEQNCLRVIGGEEIAVLEGRAPDGCGPRCRLPSFLRQTCVRRRFRPCNRY